MDPPSAAPHPSPPSPPPSAALASPSASLALPSAPPAAPVTGTGSVVAIPHAHRGREVVSHIVDVILTALVLIKFPLALLLACLFTILIFVTCVNVFLSIIPPALPSFCDLPVTSRLPICAISPTPSELAFGGSVFDRADFPSLVKIQNVVLDDLAAGSASGKDLALNVKHSELAVKDLAVVVRASNLTMKVPLGEALVEFATDARTTSRSLQKLSARINGAVDSIVSYNMHALRTIEAAKQKSVVEAGSTVLRAFQASMNGFSSQITSVMLDATAAMANLDMLETRLLNIHDLCIQESLTTAIALDDLLWEVWTIIGGNYSKLRDLRHRMAVLKEIQQYRAVAVAYVAATTQTVLLVDAQLSELRDRLTEAVVDPEEIPIEVHLASIERSLLRLQEEKSNVQVARVGSA